MKRGFKVTAVKDGNALETTYPYTLKSEEKRARADAERNFMGWYDEMNTANSTISSIELSEVTEVRIRRFARGACNEEIKLGNDPGGTS